ncbi:MAG: sensor histidine kinase [Nocardioides sp.]
MRTPGVAEQRTGDRATGPLSAATLTALAWAVGLVTTALILGTPYLVFGYRRPDLHLVLDSVDSCIAFLSAFLLYGRYLRRRRLQDLLLAEGLFLLGVAGLGLSLLVAHLSDLRPLTVQAWVPLSLRVIGALLIAIAALVGDRLAPPRWSQGARAFPWVVVAVTVGLAWFLRDMLPPALDRNPPPSTARPVLDGHPALLGAQALSAACFAVASLWFTRQATLRHDELVRWLGPAFALGAFARLNYVLFPSLYSGWLYTGDILRTGCYAVLLLGAAREIGQYWSAQTRVAVLEDRRRLARELHDGVVQELGYIRVESFGIQRDHGLRDRILGACDRALDEARGAVEALGRSGDEPLGFVLHRAARQVAERYGGRVVVDLDDSVDATPEQRHGLVRITREAVSNAIRHGSADCIRIRLARSQDGRRLIVEDDGKGFDADVSPDSGGYGLVSMRDRATGLPGSFEISSAPGQGTTVEVTW